MRTATLPGMPPPCTRDYYARLPVRLLDDARLTLSDVRVYREVLKHLDPDGACRRKTGQIADALGLDKGTVNRALGRLRRLHPPGLEHPYIEVRGGTHSRAIWPRYAALDRGDPRPWVRSKRARNCMDAARATASNSCRKSPGNQGVAPTASFFECAGENNDNDVIVVPDPPPRTQAHAHARAEPPAVAAAPPPPRVVIPPRVYSRDARAVADRITALLGRPEPAEVPSPGAAAVDGASEPLTPEIAAYRELTAARPEAEASPPSPAYTQGQARPVGRDAHTRGLVHALFRAPTPDAVGELVRHVAWLFDASKPPTLDCWRQALGEAPAWLEPDEVLEMIRAANRGGLERHKRASYFSVAITRRLVAAKRAGPVHRRE
jgi:hypothetical protein